jgi:hypothetical protein
VAGPLGSRLVEAETFHLTAERTPEGPALLGWPDALLTADPFAPLCCCSATR